MLFKYFSSAVTNPVIVVKPRRTYHTTQQCLNLCQSNLNTKYNTRLLNYNLIVKQCLNNNYFKCFTSFFNHNQHSLITKQQIDNSKFHNNRLLYISQYLGDKKSLENDKINAKDLEILSIQYPNPKNILHNYFIIVSKELNENYKVVPQFKKSAAKKNDKNPLHWTCTYNINWPEALKFQCTALTKIEASTRAACKVLLYLQESGKLLKNGLPVIYDIEDAKKITRESNFSLILDETTESKLKNINSIFETNIKPYISNIAMDEDDFSRVETNAAIAEADVLSHRSSGRHKTNKRLLKLYGAKETVELPIQHHRKEFEDLLENNRVVIIRGEPGCGKSTRIPQYVLEHWVTHMGHEHANIVVTQPRRIAAISLAERVAQERNERVGTVVGYQVRLKSEFNPQTGRILYCTTGILLRQLQADPSMSKYTHVILDEAHERDVNTDLLMNLMRHALTLNPNLKLIIMSATIDVGLFQNYFTQSPVMNVPGFTYPVQVNFLEDIKLNLPRTLDMCNGVGSSVVYHEVAQVIRWIDRTKPEGAILCFLPGWEEISKIRNLLQQDMNESSCSIVAIHSKLSHDDQKKIFRRPPPGVRKVILATNIAETSVTVDDVVYVLDTGIHKESRFDSEKGVMCIDNHWISQSSMNQRKGRAGRVQPGESFHLYTRDKYDAMLKYSVPEILRVSLTKIVLDAKVYSHNMNAIDFFTHLPCPPDDLAVCSAVQELQDLEMLDGNENLTPLGRVVSDFQLPPKLSKAMIHSVIYKCVVPIVDIATLFSSDQNMFSNVLMDKQSIKQTKERLSKDSDHIAMMILFEQWANYMNNEDIHEAATYCTRHNLVPHKMNTLKQLKDIHYDYLAKYLQNVLELSNDYSASKEFIKGVLLSGVGNVLLHRNWDVVRGRLKKGSVFVTKNRHKATVTGDSVNHKRQTYESPFLIYINEMRSEMRRTTIIRETSMIQPLTLMLFKNSELSFQQISDVKTTNIENPVLVNLEGTKLLFLCNKQQVQVIQKCKTALKQMEKYFIYQLTKGGEEYPEIVQNWNEILYLLNDVLRTK